jgi:uncharacterized protein (TIGR00296 family)
MMNYDDGITAVRVARNTITHEVTGKYLSIPFGLRNDGPSGVFVTINEFPSLRLRGCIGYIEPVYALSKALIFAARSACHDPRFRDLSESELNDIVVEVTILTPPKIIAVKDKQDLLNAIKIGRDGLVLEYKGRKGVFLPQVPVEWEWDVTEYLENLCMKSGVTKDKWKEKDCHISAFEGRIFKETTPNGEVTEVTEC